jgi:hypothetical protein
MPDWEREAQRRLENTKFPPAEREEVARELAGYLEEVSSEARDRGAKESAAAEPALAELHEDPRLGANLFRARQEGTMNDRTKQLWLPGFATLFASAVVGALLQFLSGYLSHVDDQAGAFRQFLMGQDASLLIYFLWLYALVFIGAAGAYWSRRAGSGRILQAIAGIFPVILFLTVFVGVEVAERGGTLMFPASSLFRRGVYFFFSLGVNGGALALVIIPGAALLLGVLPFLSGWGPREHPSANMSSRAQLTEPHDA